MKGPDRSADSARKSQLVLSQLCGVRMVSPGVIHDRRHSTDRRRFTVWSVIYGGFRPRRRSVRREVEHSVPVVDWHDTHLLAVAIGILLLCCADAFLTLNLLALGAQEANPVMAKLIYLDVTLFTAVKMGVTSLGVVVLVLLSRYRVFGRFRVVTTLYVALVGYAALILYELTLLAHVT